MTPTMWREGGLTQEVHRSHGIWSCLVLIVDVGADDRHQDSVEAVGLPESTSVLAETDYEQHFSCVRGRRMYNVVWKMLGSGGTIDKNK